MAFDIIRSKGRPTDTRAQLVATLRTRRLAGYPAMQAAAQAPDTNTLIPTSEEGARAWDEQQELLKTITEDRRRARAGQPASSTVDPRQLVAEREARRAQSAPPTAEEFARCYPEEYTEAFARGVKQERARLCAELGIKSREAGYGPGEGA